MASTYASIDALPLELWQQIASQLSRAEILKIRLVSPRGLLSIINSMVFENIIIDVDGTDDLPRWEEAESYGIALKRLQEIAASRIVEHVRVLTLRLTRPYSLSAYYEQKLGVKNYPVKYNERSSKVSPLKRLSSLFRRESKETISLPQFTRKVDYATELASTLQSLFKATDLVNTIRIIQPEGYNSEYDVVYPSIYARVLLRLLVAVQSVDIPEKAGLELLDLPVTHLEEAGLHLKDSVASLALTKFTSLTLKTRYMAYAVIQPGTTKYTKNSFNADTGLSKSGLGNQLLQAIGANHSQIKTLKLMGDSRTSILDPVLDTTTAWPSLRHLEIHNFKVRPEFFGPFMIACLPQLETLVLASGTLVHKVPYPVAWSHYFDVWVTLKEEHPRDQWHLKSLYASSLYSTHGFAPSLTSEEITRYAKKLTIPQPKAKGRKATHEHGEMPPY